MADLCDYELDVLRMLAGRGISLTWGAAMGAALEALKGLAALENPHA